MAVRIFRGRELSKARGRRNFQLDSRAAMAADLGLELQEIRNAMKENELKPKVCARIPILAELQECHGVGGQGWTRWSAHGNPVTGEIDTGDHSVKIDTPAPTLAREFLIEGGERTLQTSP